jgi:hypothetical protein
MPIIGLRTDFRLCADSDGGLVNAMIAGSVTSGVLGGEAGAGRAALL